MKGSRVLLWTERQFRRLAFFFLLLGIWEALARYGPWPHYLLPGPAAVAVSLEKALLDGSLLVAIEASVERLAIGFLLSVIIGTVIGFGMARFGWFKDTLGLLVLGLQALPSICWLPLALLWFGLNERAIIFVVLMGSLLSVAIAAEESIQNIPLLYLRVARNMGARGWSLYSHVVLPASLPRFVAGLKQGWSFAWRSLLAGELLFVGVGLGRLLMMGRELNDMSQVIAVMVVIILIGLAVDRLIFGVIERRLRDRWGPAGLGGI